MDKINGLVFREMIQSGSNNLANQHQEINALNVFPVPDGDTGTNMNLTFSNGAQEVAKSLAVSVSDLAKILSKGLLMGARGNSGVILSQIFRGFAQEIEGNVEIDVKQLAAGISRGKEIAYKAVMRPVEGTILTVLRESAAAAQAVVDTQDISIEKYFEILLAAAQKSLKHTPELLPVLKEVGVVDSGGAGFVAVIEGFSLAIAGKSVEHKEHGADTEVAAGANMDHDEFGYCTEFIVRLNESIQPVFKEDLFRQSLARLGNSIVVVRDEELLKVHVHTLTPGDALNLGQRYGEFIKLKIENMSEQHTHLNDIVDVEVQKAADKRKPMGIIAVAAGQGLSQYFKDLRVDEVISGGQTMNPSTEDFVTAINKVHAKTIILLPNNSNIIMAAKQAQDLIDDKQIIVIESKTVPQGLNACMMYNPDLSVDVNVEEMTAAIDHVKSAEITYAIKDTTIDDLPIKAGEFISIVGKSIVCSTPDLDDALKQAIAALVSDESELVTIIRGTDSTDESLTAAQEFITANYDVEVEVIEGQQPIYAYILGVE